MTGKQQLSLGGEDLGHILGGMDVIRIVRR
jgi:hypothetical protein